MLKILLGTLDKSPMDKLSTNRLPNLFDLILTQPSNFSLPAFVLTYIVLPLLITVAIITTGVVLPGSLVAAIFLFIAIIYSNGLIAAGLAFAFPKVPRKKRSQVHLFVSSFFPFALWRISVLILFGY